MCANDELRTHERIPRSVRRNNGVVTRDFATVSVCANVEVERRVPAGAGHPPGPD